ncbi:MAG: hypothetical protein RQ842_06185, partial [Vulcanisaeta sp.]|nr:hypothetical protein [Vulcanisaeta sp.]
AYGVDPIDRVYFDIKNIDAFHKLFDKEGLISDRMGKRSPGRVVAPPGASPEATRTLMPRGWGKGLTGDEG